MLHNASSGFPYYIALTEMNDLKALFHSQENFQLLTSLSSASVNYRYAPGKWNIKQIVGHMTDHERIMTYRALRFSRKDATELPGYDQDHFVENSRFDSLDYMDLLHDFKNVRQATISLINSFSQDQFTLGGLASNYTLTVEEALRATIGHEMHHMKVIREKYLQ